MVKLSPKDFITQLDAMFKKQPAGSVFITFKHFTGQYSVKKSGNGPLKSMPKSVSGGEPGTAMLLIRASDGNKKKISAIVTARDIVSFQISLDRLMKQNMTGFSKAGVRATSNK
ncbi:Signal recognition particle 14 kDa protein [Histomonas meleagridis]|uniref:Signal recognition particle 14 kDa protein n=1 Tax=Histomonas meleagridis TaxID=135588 RepID=UPI003559572E|nr:Signal recognition particle 14 kDa protein [Histomonas meleagridis]KAH0803113.1 Signal recognition particle 14 kDa protein [Histomonas meleagridis]